MGTLYEDTKNRYLREGREEGILIEKADTAAFLISQKGYSLDEALEIVRPDDSVKDELIRMINERLQ